MRTLRDLGQHAAALEDVAVGDGDGTGQGVPGVRVAVEERNEILVRTQERFEDLLRREGSGQGQIAAAEADSFAVTTSGQLYAWGENSEGQLGYSTSMKTPNPMPALVTLAGASAGIIRVGVGRFHTLALTASVQLYAFGANYFGQLGNSNNNKASNLVNPSSNRWTFFPTICSVEYPNSMVAARLTSA